MRADFSFVQLDDAIERGGFDIPLLDQNRLDRTHPQLHLRKMGGLIIIVIVCSHRRDTTNYRLSGQISERSTLKHLELLEQLEPLEPVSPKCGQSDREPQSAGQMRNRFRQPRTILRDLKRHSLPIRRFERLERSAAV